jgi:hypothetical protein
MIVEVTEYEIERDVKALFDDQMFPAYRAPTYSFHR